MRPINLIPPEERRGEHTPLRSGPVAYILVGALVLALAGVTALVLTGNEISDRKSEVAHLEAEDAASRAKAERLAAYTQFRDLSEQRVMTVASLADSRFDWERVMRELSLVLPSDAWLVSLTASAAPGVGGSGGGGATALRGAAPGPALELTGCANGQEAVARLVTALKDIEGVTRVGVQSSELGEDDKEGGGGSSEESGDECRTHEFIAKFEIVISFDAAPIPVTATSEATPVPVTQPAGEESSGSADESEGG